MIEYPSIGCTLANAPAPTLSCHWYVNTPVPAPATVNEALLPTQTVCAVGCVVTEVTGFTVKATAFEVAFPQVPVIIH